MSFSSPLFLLLLLLAPVIFWMGWTGSESVRRRELVSLILRLIIVVSIILALAGIEIVRKGDNLAVVFLVDVSDSMPPEAVSSEMSYLRESLDAMGADDQAAVILFGADALVERPMLTGAELGQVTSVPVTTQTDLAEAIRLGMALFPSGAAKRMVILSDGAQTTGDALKAAEFAAAAGVQIVSVPFVMTGGVEALVTGVDAPADLRVGEQFDLNITIESDEAMRAVVRVFTGSEMLYQGTHELRRGTQTLSLPLTADTTGFIRYQVQITPEQDVFFQNNRFDAFSQVQGAPAILVVAPRAGEPLPGGEARPDESAAILQVLDVAGYSVNVVTPASLPADLPTLAQYNSVVLVNVPARELGLNQMLALQTYVRDLGGGLVAIGGTTSYGVGGYYGTPLEETLPVDMQIKDEKRRPSLGIVFIIDHSGSMADTSGGVEKLELAKEAAARSIELLFPTDRVGVIAFDDTASWVVPMTELDDPGAVINAIGSIRSDGGTDIMAGVGAMADVLPADPATVKHVILLTDGGADSTGIPELVQKLYEENGITFSTVGIGTDAAPFLDDLAQLGGGRYHFTTDASSIPSIFTEEVSLASRAYIVEESFFPELYNSSPILAGIDEVPPLQGYVASSPKDLAQVILISPKEDPILAVWQYGLGRAVAFTSDASGRWARDWVRWKNFPTFWAQAIRYSLGEVQNVSLEMNVIHEGESAQIVLDAFSAGGDFLNGYQIEASIVAPNGEAQRVTLTQVAPGRYTANFTPTEPGVYLIRFAGESEDGAALAETTGWTMTYSPEYRRLESDLDLLVRLTALTGGEVASADPADIFIHNLSGSRASRPIWGWLLLTAILLLPFDIAVRRLILTKQDFIRLREFIFSRFSFAKREAVPQESTASMNALRQAKVRVRENLQTPAQADEPIALPVEPATPSVKESTPKPDVSTTSALLERKKKIKKNE